VYDAPENAAYDGAMFENVILLTGNVESIHLASQLVRLRPGLDIVHAEDRASLDAAVASAAPPVLLIAYCTDVIVPADAITAVTNTGGRAYNFHPAPPAYPGVGGPRLAVLDGAETFGVTAHVLTEQVDAGPIVAVGDFPLPDGITGFGLEQKAYGALFDLFIKTAPALLSADGPDILSDITWGTRRVTRAEMETLKVTPPADPVAADRHARAFA